MSALKNKRFLLFQFMLQLQTSSLIVMTWRYLLSFFCNIVSDASFKLKPKGVFRLEKSVGPDLVLNLSLVCIQTDFQPDISALNQSL